MPASPQLLMLTPDRVIDRRILQEADTLEAAGWQVSILAMPGDSDGMDDARVVRVRAGLSGAARETVALGVYRRLRAWLPMNGTLMGALKHAAWRFVLDQESFYDRLFLPAARRFCPQVVVAHDLPMLPLARQVARASGARLVYDSHELYSEQLFSAWERRRWREVEARHVHACDAVITVNASIARELERRHGLARVHVVHNAERRRDVPEPQRRWHRIFDLPSSARVLLMQGGLSAGRHLENLVRAMRHVRDRSVVLVLLGDGQLSGRLRDLAHEVARGRVFFHAAVPQKELLAWTVAADAGVIPYQDNCLNNRYCTPNKLFEFIAAGLPVLATDLPEIRKFVAEPDIGMVGDTATPEALAALVDAFFSDDLRLAHWRARAGELRERVCWEVEEHNLRDIYENLR